MSDWAMRVWERSLPHEYNVMKTMKLKQRPRAWNSLLNEAIEVLHEVPVRSEVRIIETTKNKPTYWFPMV